MMTMTTIYNIINCEVFQMFMMGAVTIAMTAMSLRMARIMTTTPISKTMAVLRAMTISSIIIEDEDDDDIVMMM